MNKDTRTQSLPIIDYKSITFVTPANKYVAYILNDRKSYKSRKPTMKTIRHKEYERLRNYFLKFLFWGGLEFKKKSGNPDNGTNFLVQDNAHFACCRSGHPGR